MPDPFPTDPSRPAISVGGPATPGAAPPITGARYRLGNLLGQGGMGEVRVADDRLLGRDVAVKVLATRLATSEVAIRRLEREARVTASLDHPGIVAVHDAGRLADGRPYYAMRLVRGRTLADAIVDAKSDADRARLLRHLLAACEAMAYAHRAGVVHRDLKPDNILIGGFGETQVVDWGLARRAADAPEGAISGEDVLGGDSPGGATRPGTVLGTPWWMSPEQARGDPADARSDVWGLGAILHAILTGEPPYGRGDPEAVLDALRGGPPPGRRIPASPELQAIVGRALSWDPAGRYPDAGALAADLERWFDGERVTAYAYTTFDLARRLIAAWRVPVAVGAAASVILAAVIGLGVARTRTERDKARAAASEARAAERVANVALADAMVARAVGLAVDGARADAEQAAAEALARVDSPEARGVFAAFGVSERPRLRETSPPARCTWSAAWGRERLCGGPDGLSRSVDGVEVWRRPLVGRDGAIGPAGVLVATDATVWLLARETGLAVGSWPAPHARGLSVGDRYAVVAESQRAWIVDAPGGGSASRDLCGGAIATGIAAGDTWWVACRDGRLVGPDVEVDTGLAADAEISAMAALPTGELVFGSIRGRLVLLDPRGARRFDVQSPLALVRAIRVSPDGHNVAVLDAGGHVGVWDTATGDWRAMLPDRNARAIGFVGDALEVSSARAQDRWTIPSVATPHRVSQAAGLGTAQISPDGRLLAFGGGGGVVTVVGLADGRPVRRVARVGGVAKALTFSPDSARIAITGQLGELLAVEDLVPGLPPFDVREPLFVRRLVWTAEGLCGPTFGSAIRCWGPDQVRSAAPIADLAAGAPTDPLVWLADGGQVTDGLPPGRSWVSVPGALAVDRHGPVLAVAVDEAVEVYDGNGARQRVLAAAGAGLRDVALSPEGARVAAGGLDGRVYVWRVADGRLLGVLPGHRDRVVQVDWDPSGDRLVSASWDGSARIWDATALEAPAQGLIDAVRRDWGARD